MFILIFKHEIILLTSHRRIYLKIQPYQPYFDQSLGVMKINMKLIFPNES